MNLKELAERLRCRLEGDGNIEVGGVAAIESAKPGDLTFVSNPRYAKFLCQTRASAVILGNDGPPTTIPTLRAEDPYRAFGEAVRLFYQGPIHAHGVHPTAVVAPSARIGERASIGPYCVVGERVVLGDDAVHHGCAVKESPTVTSCFIPR